MSTKTETPVTPVTSPINVDAMKIYNLTLELAQLMQQKKDAMRGYTDEIKRIKEEIKDILKGAGEDLGDGNEV